MFCNCTTLVCLIVFVSFVFASSKSVTHSKYKLCVFDSYQGKQGLCALLAENKTSKVECVFGVDRIDCLRKLLNGNADFCVLNAEDLLVAAQLNVSDPLMVTGEIRVNPKQKYKYDMVVLVSNDTPVHNLTDLKGLGLCHPGYEDDEAIFNQYFEWKVVPQVCSPRKSIIENRIDSLHQFFDRSCKAGMWSPDASYDYELKNLYSDLCATCHDPRSCSRTDLYWGRFGPLQCLTDCRGQVAWVRLQDVNLFFSREEPLQCHNVSYLCLDGTMQPIDKKPCTWLSNAWPLVVAHQNISNEISSLIKQLGKKLVLDWESAVNILLSGSYRPIHFLDLPVKASQYLEQIPQFLEANSLRDTNVNKCPGSVDDRKINICVQNNDAMNKCKLMSHVAKIYDVNPTFGCVLSDNCTDHVSAGKADVVAIGTEDLLKVQRVKELAPVLYQTSSSDTYVRHISAVVLANSSIHTIEDLRGKKACFVNTNGLGWNSFILTLRNSSLFEDSACPPSELSVSKLFSNVCITDDSKPNNIRTCFPEKLDGEYRFYRSVEENESLVLDCIIDGGGDVIFLDFNYIDKYLNLRKRNNYALWNKNYTNADFRQICPYNSSYVNDCYLMWSAHGQILARSDIKSARKEEIISAFLMLSKLFGYREERYGQTTEDNKIFKIFAPFDGRRDVLFQDAARHFITVEQFDSMTKNRRSNYETNLKNLMSSSCHEKFVSDVAASSTISSFVIISSLVLFLFRFSSLVTLLP